MILAPFTKGGGTSSAASAPALAAPEAGTSNPDVQTSEGALVNVSHGIVSPGVSAEVTEKPIDLPIYPYGLLKDDNSG